MAKFRSRALIFTRDARRAARLPLLVLMLGLLGGLFALGGVASAQTATFTAEELLGKPTDTSVTINIVPASNIQYLYEYGTATGVYTGETAPVSATADQPSEVTIHGLMPDTMYYYRMVYDADGSVTDGDSEARTEHTFRTQRAAGESFVFTVTSDAHGASGTNLPNSMTNILNEHPDFDIDLGDAFMIDGTSSQSGANTAYLNYREPTYFDRIGSSVPMFLASGNHEDEEGWNLDDTPYSTAVASICARKLYYPTPSPNDAPFYSCNTDPLAAINAGTYGDQYREDYYSWTWGDALFVVIDEFQYTPDLPYSPAAGEKNNDSVTGDQWSWTLGQQQYDWLKSTLQNSDAKYKFVFSHNMLGGIPSGTISGAGPGYVRGGAEAAGYFEWGGKNFDGTEGFAANRPTWDKTIQQLFVENGVSAYFHGHDHQYVYETRDGVVYQEVPSCGNMPSGFGGIYTEGNHGAYNTVKMLSGSAHLRIAVGSDHATVDCVSSSSTSGTVSYSYTIQPSQPSTDPSINVTGSLNAFSSQPGTPSAAQSYTVSGSNLTNDISVSAPTNFQISLTSGGPWTSTLNLARSGGTVAPTAVYVRFDRATEGTSSGNVVHTSAGATTRNLAVTGTATEPSGDPVTFTEAELLGRPTGTSVSVKVVPDANVRLYYEYGTESGSYTNETSTVTATAGQPTTVVIDGLQPNTRYYYHMRYSSDGGSTWVERDEHRFWTKRAADSTFQFDVTSDAHVNIMLGDESSWESTLDGVEADKPDFLIDLGDTVAMDNGSSSVPLGDTATAEQRYKDVLPYLNRMSGCTPTFIVAGNHEQQEAWHQQGTLANSLPIMSKNAEKKFLLNPINDSFYSGDTTTQSELSGDHLKQDYYSWSWGDALFVVISPYWTTTTKPYTTSVGGGETDATGSDDRWDWTLGLTQYNWLKSTLQNSDATYKFVFSHQMLGGNAMSNQVGYGHGGIDSANLVEWGGYNTDGTTWAWNTERAGWGSQPVRQMMEANGVTAYFHGHDHQMAYETANGMVYQAVPSASFSGSFRNYTTGNTYTVRDNGQPSTTGETVWADSTQGPGRLRVTVSPAATTVDFVRVNGSTAYTYTIPAPGVTTHSLTYTAGAGGTLTGNTSQTVADGEDGTPVTAVPSSGFHFVQWSDGRTDNPRTDTNVTQNVNVTAEFADHAAMLDGAATTKTADDVSSTSWSHTTGTGANRLLLVGVSWNCGTTDTTISSVTFTPSGGSASTLTHVFTQLGYDSSNPRYSAIYRLVNPPSGQAGTIAVNFSGSVVNGIVAGAANFAGVNQTTPLGTPAGAAATAQGTAPSLTLSGLSGNELVFDNVFQGASSNSQTLTAGDGQTRIWHEFAGNTRGAASTEQASGSSVTMSWTASSSSWWAVAAVPIKPAEVPSNDLSGATIAAIPNQTYTGSAITPTVTVTLGGGSLTRNTDYTVAYGNNTNVGTATVTVTGMGAYTGSKQATFQIVKATPNVSTWPTASAITFGQALSASSLSGGSATVGGSFAFTSPSTIPSTTGAYAASVTFTPTNTNYNAVNGTVQVQVNRASISGATIAAISDKTYTGSAITPAVTVTLSGTTLVAGTDYSVEYSSNINVGTATVAVTGTGNYTGTKSATFKIVKATPTVTWPTASAIVLGQPLSASHLSGGAASLGSISVPGSFAFTSPSTVPAAVGAYSANVTFTPGDTANYNSVAGTVQVQVQANSIDIATATIEAIADQTYTGSAITPAVIVKMGAATLVKDTDYTVAYANNTTVGTATVTVTGKGSYTGTKPASFQIVKATPVINSWPAASPIMAGQPLSACALSGGVASVEGSFAFSLPAYVPLLSGDYELTFTPADSANYTTVLGSTHVQVNAQAPVTPIDLSTATIAPIANQVYTGSAITPALVVTVGATTLVVGSDYTLAHTANVNAGKATVTVTGTGAYTGTKAATFVIVPKQSKIAKLTAGVKKFTAKWTKHSGASGYALAYSLKKASAFTTKTTTAASKTVKGLKAGKRYYVKLRAYTTIDGTRYYGAWSTTKKVTLPPAR